MIYIITASVEIKPTEDKVFYVVTPQQVGEYKKQGYKYKERRYKVTIGHQDIEIICPEIWKKGDAQHQVIIPANIIPRRSHPLEVYVYAINIYSNEAEKSQRAAAEATKKHFDLKKFSHTTIGRVMKKLSDVLGEYPSVCTAPWKGKQIENREKARQCDAFDESCCKKQIPSMQDTQKRRGLIAKFFQSRLNSQSRLSFMETCGKTAIWWYTQFNRLLI